MEFLRKLWTDEEGQGLVEYGLIIALVAVFLIGALIFLGDGIDELFRGISFKRPAGE